MSGSCNRLLFFVAGRRERGRGERGEGLLGSHVTVIIRVRLYIKPESEDTPSDCTSTFSLVMHLVSLSLSRAERKF